MSADDQTRSRIHAAQPLLSLRGRLRGVSRRAAWRLVPSYARRRTREAEMAGAMARLEADFEHTRERHTEQIERLEGLVRELILTSESLRRAALPENRGGS